MQASDEAAVENQKELLKQRAEMTRLQNLGLQVCTKVKLDSSIWQLSC
jgi:hypothetical protein